MATDSEKLFTQTPPVRLFFTAAIPGALGMLASSVYGLVDGVFVGQFVGEAAFAAVNLAMPFVILAFAFGDLVGVGSAVPISIAHGQGERERANNIFTCACIMNVALGLLCGLFFLLGAPAIMAAMGATGDVSRLAALYLRVYAVFLPLTSIAYAADNYLRICGRINRSLFANILMAVSGAIIEFVLLGVVGLGVGASAFSYCVGMALCVLVSLWPFIRGGMELKFVKPRFSVALVREIVADGGPTFLENVAGRLASIALNAALLAQGGVDAVSIFGVLMFCATVVIPMTYGTLDSVQPAVGFNYGAGNRERVQALERCCYAAAAVIGVVGFVLTWVIPSQIVQIFVPDATGAFMDEAIRALRIFSLTFAVQWFPYATQAYMICVGEPRAASILTVVQSLIAPLILLVVLWPLGLTGLWLNMPVASVVSSVLAVGVLIWFKRKA